MRPLILNEGMSEEKKQTMNDFTAQILASSSGTPTLLSVSFGGASLPEPNYYNKHPTFPSAFPKEKFQKSPSSPHYPPP